MAVLGKHLNCGSQSSVT